MDYCYEQNEENEVIFSREVKPLISGVFNGCNSTIIAYGARNTGKTSVIQVGSILLKFSFVTNVDSSIVFFGITCILLLKHHWILKGSCEKPGLAALAMTEILSMAEENGKSVAISFYEVHQDRICDLLDSKQQAVFVLEDAQGRIQLKGLSRVSCLVFLFVGI